MQRFEFNRSFMKAGEELACLCYLCIDVAQHNNSAEAYINSTNSTLLMKGKMFRSFNTV